MKNIILAIAVLLVASCTEDTQLPEIDGLYTAQSLDLTASMQIEGGCCVSFDVQIKGESAGTWTQISTTGKYPDYTYDVEGLRVRAHFNNVECIAARLDGVLRSGYSDGPNMENCSLPFDDLPLIFSKQ